MAQPSDQMEFAKKYGRVVAKAWADGKFKSRLLSDPAGALKEFGLDVPAGTQVRVVEETETVNYLVLPAKPTGDLSLEQLESVSAAGCATRICETKICM